MNRKAGNYVTNSLCKSWSLQYKILTIYTQSNFRISSLLLFYVGSYDGMPLMNLWETRHTMILTCTDIRHFFIDQVHCVTLRFWRLGDLIHRGHLIHLSIGPTIVFIKIYRIINAGDFTKKWLIILLACDPENFDPPKKLKMTILNFACMLSFSDPGGGVLRLTRKTV